MSEPEFDNEMAEAIRHAEGAEVVCVIIPMINQCLVYDSRTEVDDPPRVFVSPPLGSAERRLRHANKARPNLKHARELAVLPWTGSINSMAHSRIWEMIVTRMASSGFDGMDEKCVEALEELKQWERQSLVAMIKGQGPYHTIWSRTGV
ncbi:MAG: hypothetical protein V3S98_00185 [Dehalococcoidia bacterium]